MKKKFVTSTLLIAILACLSFYSCSNDDNEDAGQLAPGEGSLNLPPLNPQLVEQGKEIFRYDTFGDESFWTDVLQMNEVIETAVSPATALSVGLKVDAEALPPAVVEAIQNGQVDLDDPQTTLALLQLNAVVGVQGEVSENPDGTLKLDRMGITCALCHSTVDDSFAPGIGSRLDGWPNKDLDPGLIISLSPALDQQTKEIYASWGPGIYDPRFSIDGINNPVVIPPAYGLYGLPKAIFTGDGDIEHEPAGPVAYWNRYVAVTQMHGHGYFSDPRLNLEVDYREGDDLVTDKLPALQEYQFSLSPPTAPVGSFNVAAAERGKELFSGKAECATCHSGPLFTDVIENGKLHPQSASVAVDKDYVNRSATKQWRVTPLKGIWQHPPYFHDGSAATLADVVERYNNEKNLNLSNSEKADLTEYLKSI
ncbi:c-type cytochrome [Marixanthomonas sp. SCSIO 43207]|uniref:c-type cytochrome n=1 Tax=Marixanthomonas sp. SCSIO 43207 TaxID=2779360 RepID=UPI001CA9FF8E|nr:c-type cytochrome [Marixanthomonas sp. SCSIO 43207]UAB82399.1 c-type cytochrome [Marixanthomonas sp. SCSIO 43207]